MNEKQSSSLPYQEAIKQLVGLIYSETYDEGGWFPPVQELAERFAINRLTCLKALKFLKAERAITSFPAKGYYVTPKNLRIRKIALILEQGEDLPFVRPAVLPTESSEYNDFAGAINHIYKSGYSAQIFHARKSNNIATVVESYGVSGVLWFFPAKDCETEVKYFVHSATPFIVIDQASSDYDFYLCRIGYDEYGNTRRDADFLLKRGHKNILFVGRKEIALRSNLAEIIKKAGGHFSKDHCLDGILKNTEKLHRLIREKNITAILKNTTNLEQGYLRRELCKIPFDKQPELLVGQTENDIMLGHEYQPVKTVLHNRRLTSLPGIEAAKTLISHLNTGVPLHSYDIGYA